MNQSGINPATGGDKTAEEIEDSKSIFMIDEVFNEEKIINSPIFVQQAKLLEDPRLEGNQMHWKLVARLTAFYLT